MFQINLTKHAELRCNQRGISALAIETIIKYGHDIGKVVKSIKKGDHVHVHNVKTKKW